MLSPEKRLAIAYAPAAQRPVIAALFTLDDVLASILRSTSNPMVGQMRLTWWHEALARLDSAPPPAQPVLQALARYVVPGGTSGAMLAGIVAGWEELLEPDPLPDAALIAFAELRGATLFNAGGVTSDDPLGAAGAGWALIDLARHSRDPHLAERVSRLARPLLAEACNRRWTRANRGLGMLARLAAMDDAGPMRRISRALWHRMTGL